MPEVIIAEDTPLIGAAIARMVASDRADLGPPVLVAGGDEAVAAARMLCPDLVLLDVEMPGVGEAGAGSQPGAERPVVRLVFLTPHHEFGLIQQALRIAADHLLEPARPSPLDRALAFMEQNLHRSDLRLGEVAATAHVSPSHLAALIRRGLGRSYQAHLGQLRIERAKELLRNSDLTVAAVAAAVGYETPAPFYQRFKRAVGETPGAFRSRHRCALAR